MNYAQKIKIALKGHAYSETIDSELPRRRHSKHGISPRAKIHPGLGVNHRSKFQRAQTCSEVGS